MSLVEIKKQVLDLPLGERRELFHWMQAHQYEPLEDSEEGSSCLSPEQRAELELRVKEIEEHPELLEPWEKVRAELYEFLHELRHPVQHKS